MTKYIMIEIITPPTEYPVTLEQLKENSIIDADIEVFDTFLSDTLKTAVSWVQKETGRTCCTTTYRWKGASLGYPFIIPRPPFVSLDLLAYLDTNEDEQEIDSDEYIVMKSTDWESELYLTEPVYTACRPDAWTIEWTAGTSQANVDPILKDLVILYVAHRFKNREAETEKSTKQYQLGVDRLLKQITPLRYV